MAETPRTSPSAAALVVLAALTAAPGGAQDAAPRPADEQVQRVIVRAQDVETAEAAVVEVGARVLKRLPIIRSVGAEATPGQVEALEAHPDVQRVFADSNAELAGGSGTLAQGIPLTSTWEDSLYPSVVRAAELHDEGLDGSGVTVAVLDSGIAEHPALLTTSADAPRVVARYDALGQSAGQPVVADDLNGHGTHVASIVASGLSTTVGGRTVYNAVAPGAGLVAVRAFDANGMATYMDVIDGLGWILANEDLLGIRVVNLSLSAPVRSHYWDDPLNLAVMELWRAGVVVVSAAGNRGPDPQTIGVPGNVPYVVTVGAVDGKETLSIGDDELAFFSATGPTYEGFVKPEVVAPGARVLGVLPLTSTLATDYPQFYTQIGEYFTLSGTSQATAVVSGVVALMLQADPSLSPDDVKCGLLDGARAAVDANGDPALSVFQQGAGLVDAYTAVHGGAAGCANGGLDIELDLAGIQHYAGRADRDANGDFYLVGSGSAGSTWDGSFGELSGFAWADNFAWTNGFAWADSFAWTNGFAWADSYVATDAFAWADSALASVVSFLTVNDLIPERPHLIDPEEAPRYLHYSYFIEDPDEDDEDGDEDGDGDDDEDGEGGDR